MIWQFYIYIIVSGLAPGLGSFEYYFLQDVLGVTQFTYSMLSLASLVFIVVAISVY